MTTVGDEDERDRGRSPGRADFYHYEDRRREPVENRNWIAIDKTTVMIMGAIGSAALAVAIAGGTALVQKVDETAYNLEKGRADRIEALGEVSKNIGIIETKVNQMIAQVSQLETRIERSIEHDLESRDRKIEQLEHEISRVNAQVNDLVRDQRRPPGR